MTGRGRFAAPALLVLAAFLAYGGPRIADLGFYHDDWWFLSVMRFGEPGFLGRIRALYADTGTFHLRPLDPPLLSLLFGLFGLEPLGWQAFSLAAHAACAWGTFAVLRAWGIRERVAVLGAVVALSYPNKDGAMFWPMTVIIPVSYALFLSGYLCHLRWVRDGRRGALAAVPLTVVASLAVYDQSLVQLAAWALVPAAVSGAARSRLRAGLAVAWGSAAAFMTYKFLLVPKLFGVAFNKPLILSFSNAAIVTLRAVESTLGYRLWGSVLGGAWEAFGMRPFVFLLAAAVPWAVSKTIREDESPGAADARRLATFAAVLFVLGYLPFLVSDYRPTPLTHMNRVNFVPSAALGLLAAAAAARWPRRGGLALSWLVGLFLCAHVGFGSYWSRGWDQVRAAREVVLRDLSAWPAEATLLFAWTDPMVGGHAPALLASWDATGAVRLWTGEAGRKADTLRRGVKLVPGGVAVSGRVLPLDLARILDPRQGRIVELAEKP